MDQFFAFGDRKPDAPSSREEALRLARELLEAYDAWKLLDRFILEGKEFSGHVGRTLAAARRARTLTRFAVFAAAEGLGLKAAGFDEAAAIARHMIAEVEGRAA